MVFTLPAAIADIAYQNKAAPRRPTQSLAVSSLGGFPTPAPEYVAPTSWGRHPKTFTKATSRGRSSGRTHRSAGVT
jgi:hypothetical protein